LQKKNGLSVDQLLKQLREAFSDPKISAESPMTSEHSAQLLAHLGQAKDTESKAKPKITLQRKKNQYPETRGGERLL